jgi:hypothetical protein
MKLNVGVEFCFMVMLLKAAFATGLEAGSSEKRPWYSKRKHATVAVLREREW